MPEIVALEVYGDYQQRLPGWPLLPPGGLRVAVNADVAGVQGRDVAVVELNVPQPAAGLSSAGVPPLLADPSLDLDDAAVRSQIMAAGIQEGDLVQAVVMQENILDMLSAEEFGTDTGLPVPGQGTGPHLHPATETFPHTYPEAFAGIDISGLDLSGQAYAAGPSGPWPSPAGPLWSPALGHLPPGSGQQASSPYAAGALAQPMGDPSVTSTLHPTASPYGHANVAAASWNTLPAQQPPTQPTRTPPSAQPTHPPNHPQNQRKATPHR